MLDTGWTNVGQVFVIILLVTRLLLTKLLQTKKQPHIQIIFTMGYQRASDIRLSLENREISFHLGRTCQDGGNNKVQLKKQ